MVVESGSYGAFARCQACFHHIPLGFIKKVGGLGGSGIATIFIEEIHGLPPTEKLMNKHYMFSMPTPETVRHSLEE
jgi:hypothetical protein